MGISDRDRLYRAPKNVYFIGAKYCMRSFKLCAGVFLSKRGIAC